MKKNKSRVILSIVTLLLFSFSAWAEEGVLRVGSIGMSPKEEVKKFQIFADYLAGQLSDQGITRGKVVVARSMEKMVELIQNGEVDIYIDSPFPAYKVSQASGSKIFLRRWKKGVAEYHTMFFVRKDSGISTVDDLKGKMIAFEEPYSTTGYFFTKAVLIKMGFKLVKKHDPAESVAADEIGYVFSYNDTTSLVWVIRNKVVGASMGNEKLAKIAGADWGDIKVILETDKVPRQVVSYRPDIEPKLLARIEQVLIDMDKRDDGKHVLKEFENTVKFDHFPLDLDTTFKPISELADNIDK